MINLNRRSICQMPMALCATSAWWSSFVRAETPIRVVCIGGALTELMYELGLEKYLVGVDTSSNFPSMANLLPNVGYARTLSAEGILSMRPTHVVCSANAGPQHVVTILKRNKKIHFSQFDTHHRFEGLLQIIKELAYLFDVSKKGDWLTERLLGEWAPLSASHGMASGGGKASGVAPKVLFILSHRGSEIVVGGKDTEADAMIEYAGGVNVASSLKGYKSFSKEIVIQTNPDIILMTQQSEKYVMAVLKTHYVSSISAIRNQRFIAIEANQLLGFGPRLPMTVAQLRKAFFV